jgi:hypothetical protein
MEYLTVEEARERSGLRLVLTRGVPGPWSEAAKALFTLRNVDYAPVQQIAGGDNPELVEWTRHRNAPIALYENEAPRVRWLELLDLAERLGSGPSLIPENRDDRMLMLGLINEIAGERGMSWNARLLMFHAGIVAQGPGAAKKTPCLQIISMMLRRSQRAQQKSRVFWTIWPPISRCSKARDLIFWWAANLRPLTFTGPISQICWSSCPQNNVLPRMGFAPFGESWRNQSLAMIRFLSNRETGFLPTIWCCPSNSDGLVTCGGIVNGRDGDTPVATADRKVVDINRHRWQRHCRGLFELPVAV